MNTDNALLPESVIPSKEKFGDYRDQFFPGVKILSKASKRTYTVTEEPIPAYADRLRDNGYQPVWVNERIGGWVDSHAYVILGVPLV